MEYKAKNLNSKQRFPYVKFIRTLEKSGSKYFSLYVVYNLQIVLATSKTKSADNGGRTGYGKSRSHG